MTIHAYYGDYSQLKNEKLMLDDLLTQLKLNWEHTEDWIYVFYNTMWSGQEIDIVIFTQKSIIVADLKNYSGSLEGSENGEWLIDSNISVKGGSQINPFVQIRKNKFAVLEWFKSVGLFSNQNLGFITGCIIFNELTQKQMELSEKVKKWFYVTDIPHVTDILSNINSAGIDLAEDDVRYLITKLKLKNYNWDQAKTPRDIRYSFTDEQFQPLSIHTNQYSSSIKLKYSLNDKVATQFNQEKVSYILFVLTVFICLIVAFYIASEMYYSGQGAWYIHKLIFGKN